MKWIPHYYLKRSGDSNYVQRALESKELYDLVDSRQKSFWWQPGQYEVSFELSSPRRLTLRRSKFSFELSKIEIDQLRQNIEAIKVDLDNAIRSNLAEFEKEPLNWNWATVNLRKA